MLQLEEEAVCKPESLIRDFYWRFANELFTVLQREMVIITTFTIPKLS